jgi:hypothetical protein
LIKDLLPRIVRFKESAKLRWTLKMPFTMPCPFLISEKAAQFNDRGCLQKVRGVTTGHAREKGFNER